MKYSSVKVEGHDYSFPMAEILPSVICEEGKTIKQIASEVGRQQQSVNHLLLRLKKKEMVHISGWSRGKTGGYMAHYKWGYGNDAIRPEPTPQADRCKKYRETAKGKAAHKRARKRWVKSEGGKDYCETYNKGRYARDKFKEGGVQAIDPLLAAIMGIK